MIHLSKSYSETACGSQMEVGDSRTLNRQKVTCSACQMPGAMKLYEEFVAQLEKLPETT